MQIPPEIAFQHVEPSDDIQALIAEKITLLEKIYDGIICVHIQIRTPHQRKQTGNRFAVTIEIRVPRKAQVVRKEQGDAARHEHLRATLRDAFAAMAIELKRWKDTIKGEVKSHDGPLQGRIVQLDQTRAFGQNLATDNRLIYSQKTASSMAASTIWHCATRSNLSCKAMKARSVRRPAQCAGSGRCPSTRRPSQAGADDAARSALQRLLHSHRLRA